MSIIRKIFLHIVLFNVITFFYCQKNYRTAISMENPISVQTGYIKMDFVIGTRKIKNCRDLRLKTVFRNTGESPIKINALFFKYPTLVLKIRRADGTPVFPGPPPFPPQDDGKIGRIEIAPGECDEIILSGADYFGSDVSKGKYQVLFTHTAPENNNGDWVGIIQSPWIDFEITGMR